MRGPLLILFALAAIGQAAAATVIELTIVARNAQHQPLSSVTISVQTETQQQAGSCRTDASGACHLTLPAGKYVIRAESKRDSTTVTKQLSLYQSSSIEMNLEPAFFDEPQFTVAGVTDNSYRGGHGADTVLRSSEDLAKAAGKLSSESAQPNDLQPLETVRQLQHRAEQSPSEANLFNWGIELLSHRAAEAASEVFTKGVRLFPQSMRMLLALASSQYAGGNYRQAAANFFAAADLNSADATPYEFLALVQAKEITQLAEYRARLKNFALGHPQNALANYYYAVNLWDEDHSPESIPLLKQAILTNPHLAVAYLQLGIIAAANRQYTEAIAYYQQAVVENASLEEAHYRLADAYRVTGESAKVATELAEYRRLNGLNSEARERERSQTQQFVMKLKSQ